MGLRYERQRDRGWQGGTVSLFLTTVDAACDFQLVRMKRRELLQRLQAASPQYREAAFVQMILRGIAFHHDLEGNTQVLLVLVATSTLAVGVNLPAQRVIIRDPMVGRALVRLLR